jgi:orotate phosphoribosyltransferase
MDLELLHLARDIDVRCRLNGQFTLRSGQTARTYFDKYLFESDPILIRRVVRRMVNLVHTNVDMLGGLEPGRGPADHPAQPTDGTSHPVRAQGSQDLRHSSPGRGRRPGRTHHPLGGGRHQQRGRGPHSAHALRAQGATVTSMVCAIDRTDEEAHPLAPDGLAVCSVLTQNLLDYLPRQS